MKIWIILLILFVLLFQVLGLLAFISLIVIYQLLKLQKNRIEGKDLFKTKDSQGNIFHQLDQYEIDTSHDIFDINKLDSYKDILYQGSENEKIELIGMAVFNPTKEFVSLMRIALEDKSETVRILASNSLQKMENLYEDKIYKLENSLKKESSREKKESLYIETIKTYDKYIDSTLIDQFLEKQYIDKVFSIFKTFYTSNSNKKTKKLYLETSIKYNRIDSIANDLEELIKSDNSIENNFLLIQYYYKKSNFKKIYEILTSIDKNQVKNSKYKNSYEFWMQNVS